MKRGHVHNDLRDSDAALVNWAWGGVAIEPAPVPEDDQHGPPALRADWMARDVLESGRAAFFNNISSQGLQVLTSQPIKTHGNA